MICLVYANSSSMSLVKHKMIYIFNWFLIEMENCCLDRCVCVRVLVYGGCKWLSLWP